mmetsp:Transcript_4287/g.12300  ORF Transcript_4287/g.12300 Transcript_4287/m.12300 type:complete len:140 (-) Transcript_4287:477-896(-)
MNSVPASALTRVSRSCTTCLMFHRMECSALFRVACLIFVCENKKTKTSDSLLSERCFRTFCGGKPNLSFSIQFCRAHESVTNINTPMQDETGRDGTGLELCGGLLSFEIHLRAACYKTIRALQPIQYMVAATWSTIDEK